MSSILRVQIRTGATLLPPVLTIQSDNASLMETLSMGGAIPNYQYDGYVEGVPLDGNGNYLLQQGAMLVDVGIQAYSYDARTISGKREWQIVGIPEPFDTHVELKLVQYIEKTVNEHP